jgi:glycosyltransferase involved in cell wall biosynthesis
MIYDEGFTISAIIPVYNGKEFLRHAVESVINQTTPPNELIIIDDGSSDNSLDSINDIEADFPIIKITQKNGGQSSARNHGVKLAKSSFIAFLDQDDHWFPRHLEVLIEPFINDPMLGWVYSNLNQIDENGKTVINGLLDHVASIHPKKHLGNCIKEDMFILPSASIIRKKAFESIGGFDERLSGYEDDDLFLRLFREGWNNTYINESLSAWRIHNLSTSYSKRMLISRRIYVNKLFESFPDQLDFGMFYKRDYIAPRFYKIAQQEYKRGIRVKNLELCRESHKDMITYSKYFRQSPYEMLKIFVMGFPWFIDKLYRILRKS